MKYVLRIFLVIVALVTLASYFSGDPTLSGRREASSPAAARGMSPTVSGLNIRMARFYEALLPSPKRLRAAPVFVREFVHDCGGHFGVGLAFVLLVASATGLSWLIQVVDRRARL